MERFRDIFCSCSEILKESHSAFTLCLITAMPPAQFSFNEVSLGVKLGSLYHLNHFNAPDGCSYFKPRMQKVDFKRRIKPMRVSGT